MPTLTETIFDRIEAVGAAPGDLSVQARRRGPRPAAAGALPPEYYVHVTRAQTGVDPDHAAPTTEPALQWEVGGSDVNEAGNLPIGDTGDLVTVFRGGGNNNLQRLTVADGSQVWEEEFGCNQNPNPIRVGDLVIFCCDGGATTAFDLATGAEQWQTDVIPGGNTETSGEMVSDGDRVFIALEDDRTGLLALDLDDGSEVWHHDPTDVGNHESNRGALAFNDGVVFGGFIDPSDPDNDRKVIAVNADDGTRKWDGPLELTVIEGISVANGRVAYPTRGGIGEMIFVLDEEDGSELRRFDIGGEVFGQSPIRDGTTGIIGTLQNPSGLLEAYDLTDGTQLWSRADGEYEKVGRIDSNGQLIVADSGDNLIRSIDPSDGSQNWSHAVGGLNRQAQPGFHDGTVVVADQDTIEGYA